MKRLNRVVNKELDVDEARTAKWYAAADAKRRDRENQHLWSMQDLLRLQSMTAQVSSIYASRVFTNLRQKFMVIKVENPRIHDRNSTAAINFDRAARAEGIEIVRTKTALLYRIK